MLRKVKQKRLSNLTWCWYIGFDVSMDKNGGQDEGKDDEDNGDNDDNNDDEGLWWRVEGGFSTVTHVRWHEYVYMSPCL